jgi:alpha-glucoside transport system substrate-binding protein
MKSIVFGEIIMKKIKMKKRFGFIGTLMVAIVALTGVAHADSHLKFPIGEGGFNWDSYHAFAKEHDYTGQQVTWTTRVTGSGETNINNMMAYFAEATGAKVKHVGSQTYKQDVVANLEGGTPPEITGISLPGFGQDLSRRGFFTPLCEDPNDCELSDWIRENYASGDAWADLGIWEGPDGKKHFYGFHYYTYVKSMVWYVPENFEDAGYEIPQTMEELKALEDQIVADGGTPWCHGLFAEGSTGFTGELLMEDYLLRSQPLEVFDKFTTNEIKMDDPRIVAALEEMGERLRNEKYVAGGPSNVATQDWRVAANGILTNPPQCYLYQEGTYIPTLFPEDKKYGDWDFFYFPTRANRPDLAKYPVNGGGAFFTITKDSPAARGLLEWLKTPIAAELMMAQGGFLTAHKHVNKALFADDATAVMNEMLMNADPFRFNAGEVFPSAVGGVCLNRAMVDYVGGKSAKDVLSACQEIWDGLK